MNINLTLTVRTERCSFRERLRNLPRVWRTQYRTMSKQYGPVLAIYGVWALAGKKFIVKTGSA